MPVISMWTLLEKKKKKGPIKSHGCNIYSLMHLAGLALGVRVFQEGVCFRVESTEGQGERERKRERGIEREGEREREMLHLCTVT